jgi:hypothetical protein
LPRPDLSIHVLRSRGELPQLAELSTRLAYEQAVASLVRSQSEWRLAGYCAACDAGVQLIGDWKYSDGVTPNFRECLHCPRCGLNNRQRFIAGLVRERPEGRIYMYERVTPFYAWAKVTFPDVLGSEYLGPDIPSGTVVEGIRHEDALALSLEDRSVATIVSQDVFEHVPDIDAALREAARVLQPGGRLLFSIPFFSASDATVQRAEIRDGRVVELLPPEYHGNPIDAAGGSLVFYEHGWDILDRCRAAGFADAYVLGYWSALYGHLGQGLQPSFVAEAPY